jgi:hypothetical protein
MTRTGVTPPTDYNYGFWFDGIDDSVIKLRTENSGDADNIVAVVVADSTALELGTRDLPLKEIGNALPGIVYFDGPTGAGSGNNVSAIASQRLFADPNLYFGSPLSSYYDPHVGGQSSGNINGCSYSAAGSELCNSTTVSNYSGNLDIEGLPNAFTVAGHTGKVEVHSDTIGGGSAMSSQSGPASVNCTHCSLIRWHGSAAGSGGQLNTDGFSVSGTVDKVQNDAITPSSTFAWYRFGVIQLSGYLGSIGNDPYGLGPVGSHIGPGLIALTGGRKYEWYIDDPGAIAANTCMRKTTGSALTPVACTDPEAFFEYLPGKSFLGRVLVELTEAVESTLTECDLTIEIAGGCTACTDGETGTGKVFKIGGKDLWDRNLRAAGDWTQWALNDPVTGGQNITAELRPVVGGTACTLGAGCTCDGVNGLKVTVDELPALYDQ